MKETGSQVIHPTGTCFEDVTLEFARMHREDPKTSRFMVHGICLKEDGKPYAHAWIEEWQSTKKTVWFSGILDGQPGFFETSRQEFYDDFRVQESTHYSIGALVRLADKYGDSKPPWKDRYRKLCKEYSCDDDKCLGWYIFDSMEHGAQIQRCDTCKVYPSDELAAEAAREFIERAKSNMKGVSDELQRMEK